MLANLRLHLLLSIFTERAVFIFEQMPSNAALSLNYYLLSNISEINKYVNNANYRACYVTRAAFSKAPL